MALVDSNKAQAVVNGLGSLSLARQVGVLIGFAVSIAIGVSVAMWSMTPNYQPLFNHVDMQDASAIMDSLQSSGIDYKLDQRLGTILVDAGSIQQARIKLAAEGLPHNSGPAMDILGKSSGFGSSQFIESARYRHALEAELAQTIGSFRSVKSARVHLAIPKQSPFLRDKKRASASVFVDAYAGSRLSQDKVASIVLC